MELFENFRTAEKGDAESLCLKIIIKAMCNLCKIAYDWVKSPL